MKVSYANMKLKTNTEVNTFMFKDTQIEVLKSHVKTKCLESGIECKYKIYEDPGFSGAALERPAIKQLIQDCIDGKIDSVYEVKRSKK